MFDASALSKYEGNCGTRNGPEKFRDLCEIRPRPQVKHIDSAL